MPVAPGGMIRSTVLPGFQWRVDDLDRQPPLETLVSDPVYRDYVRLPYQQERQRAERLAAENDAEILRSSKT